MSSAVWFLVPGLSMPYMRRSRDYTNYGPLLSSPLLASFMFMGALKAAVIRNDRKTPARILACYPRPPRRLIFNMFELSERNGVECTGKESARDALCKRMCHSR